MGIIYCYHDLFSWGTEVSAEVNRLKGSSLMMSHAVQVENDKGVCAFGHVSKKEQAHVKELWSVLGAKQNVYLLPSADEVRIHDDLVQQYVEFGFWMPTTYLFRDKDSAFAHVPQLLFPLISRSSSGAYENMRILHTHGEAMEEVQAAFSDEGIALVNGRVQKDYLFWQPVWETQGHNYHVVMVGQRYAVITVIGAEDNPSQENCGFGTVDAMDARFDELLTFTRLFCEQNDFNFVSVEVAPIKDRVRGEEKPCVLGVSAAWPFKWFHRGGMIFEFKDEKWQSMGIPAIKIWMVVAKWLMEKAAI